MAPSVSAEHDHRADSRRYEQPVGRAVLGVVRVERQHQQCEAQAEQQCTDPVDRGGAGRCWKLHPARRDDQARGADRRQREVEPEHKTPAAGGGRRRGERGPIDWPKNAARLLQRCNRAEGQSARLAAIEIGGESQGERHQPAPAEALDEPAGHQPGQSGKVPESGCRCHHRGSRKSGHASDVHGHAAPHVRVRTEQRHGDDIAGEEAGHDRSPLLETFDRQADVAHHRGQQGHDHVRVQGRDKKPGSCQREQDPAVQRRRGRGVIDGSSAPTRPISGFSGCAARLRINGCARCAARRFTRIWDHVDRRISRR